MTPSELREQWDAKIEEWKAGKADIEGCYSVWLETRLCDREQEIEVIRKVMANHCADGDAWFDQEVATEKTVVALKEAFRLVSLRYMAEHDEACRLRQKYEPDGVESESVTRSIERSPE